MPETSVAGSPAIHVQQEKAADLFWQVAAVVALFFVAVIIAIAIGVPILLMLMFWNPWLLFLLVMVAGGVWLLVKTVAAVRNMAWRSRHRSRFELRQAGIETTEWNTLGADFPVRRTIPFDSVTGVVASYRIVRRMVRVNRMIPMGNGPRTITETAPVLHVLFHQDGRRQITSIPFTSHQDPGVDTWIAELRKRGVELGYTSRFLVWQDEKYLSDEARLEYFKTTGEVIPFPEAGGWLENVVPLDHLWSGHTRQLQEQAEQRDPALRAARLKPTARDWLRGAWFATMYALGSSYLLLHLVNDGTLPAGSWPLGVGVILPAAALFFLPLRHGLRWYHALGCWLLLLVISFTGVVNTLEVMPAAEQVALALLGLTAVSPALLWIPYLLVKRTALSGGTRSAVVPHARTATRR
ncbi:hypothetical protein [Arthrobacter sp. UYEF36]|uniref:hypothetical protein n=1 Tax=Arthrobacter sp. UYEF36 TaxID=1756366 RepID=UPI00339B0339